jgi:predicted GIY-YIG superfamily endonuclease
METYIYVLRLTGECYYVGKTQNVVMRYQQHLNGNGAHWTRLHAPLELMESYKTTNMFEEDRKTKEMMAKYGIDKVRGGAYTREVLDCHTVEFIQKEIWSGQDRCTRCGYDTHHIINCRAKLNIFGESIQRSY